MFIFCVSVQTQSILSPKVKTLLEYEQKGKVYCIKRKKKLIYIYDFLCLLFYCLEEKKIACEIVKKKNKSIEIEFRARQK